ncbi:MAG: hypothetical protein ACRDVW_06765 [Acidimicrobiales bacterium]
MGRTRLTPPYVVLAVLVLATVLGAGLGLSEAPVQPDRSSADPSVPPTTIISPTPSTSVVPSLSAVSVVPLPSGSPFSQLFATDTGIFVTGITEQASLNEGSSLPPQSCKEVSAPISAETMQIGPNTGGNCDDPMFSGETVGVVDTPLPHSDTDTVAIAVVDPQTGQVSTGPVVMSYSFGSDSRLVTAYGGGWLWVYDVATPNGPEVLQVSAASGQVADTIAMPRLFRPVVVANDAGLWVGNSIAGSSGPATSPSLYHVAPGSTTPIAVLTDTAGAVCWMVGSDEDLWVSVPAAIPTACSSEQTLEGFNGSDIEPVFMTTLSGFEPTWMVNNESAVIGNQTDGLWTASYVQSQDVIQFIRINPDTGAEAVVATVPGPSNGADWPSYESPLGGGASGVIQTVVFEGSLFFLELPNKAEGFDGSLVRVTPSGASH